MQSKVVSLTSNSKRGGSGPCIYVPPPRKGCHSYTPRHQVPFSSLPTTFYIFSLSEIQFYFFFYYLICEAIGTAAIPGLLCQPRVIVKVIVEKQMECRLARETEVLGENLPQRHSCPSENPT
jgi:hypothetical protein